MKVHLESLFYFSPVVLGQIPCGEVLVRFIQDQLRNSLQGRLIYDLRFRTSSLRKDCFLVGNTSPNSVPTAKVVE